MLPRRRPLPLPHQLMPLLRRPLLQPAERLHKQPLSLRR
jgi:hypothetical protein